MPNLMVFWRILFDVICGHVLLRKEFTVWDANNLVRLSNGTIALEWLPVGNVYVHADRVEFRGGHLKCIDKPIYVSRWLTRGSVSNPNLGENVAVSAKVKLPNQDDTTFPIFYYPQVQNQYHLALSVLAENQQRRRINWKIESEPIIVTDPPYVISGRDGWHRIRVRQDQDWETDPNLCPKKDYFEFLVDSVPIVRKEITPANPPDKTGKFTFTPAEKVFYIGRVPVDLNNTSLDPYNPNDWLCLDGDLQHLEFDPNDSCPSCG